MKGEEYQADESLDEYLKWGKKYYTTFANNEDSIFYVTIMFDVLTGYIKI